MLHPLHIPLESGTPAATVYSRVPGNFPMTRIKVKTNPLTFIFLFLMTSIVWSGERQVDYEGFTLWLDCGKRGASRFEYSLGEDAGNEKRLNKRQFFSQCYKS
jgi:hypothetical protein